MIFLAAEINITKYCLDVHCLGEIYSVYAQPYTVSEIHELLDKSLYDFITKDPFLF